METKSFFLRDHFFLRVAFVIATLATLGSLYFSEVMKLPPCSLCWYQRICMYPLVPIFFIGLITTGSESFRYALPLVSAGLAISIYHNLLYYGIIPDSIVPCSAGVSCTSKQIEWLGFITIPLLSMMAFIGLFLITIFRFKSLQRNF